MNITMGSGHLTEALARAHQHWQQRQAERTDVRAPAAFAIAFSRQCGTYGAAIAREVGNRLGWPVYDRELLKRIAEDLGVHQTLLESIDEKQRGWLGECVWGFFTTPDVNETVYFRRLVDTSPPPSPRAVMRCGARRHRPRSSSEGLHDVRACHHAA